MTRPALEVADILRARGDHFLDRYRSSIDFQQRKAFRAIQRCRTAVLGGHVDVCSQCGRQEISYNSCRNRNCPKCQTLARRRWLAARERELLPTLWSYLDLSSSGTTRSADASLLRQIRVGFLRRTPNRLLGSPAEH